MEAGLASKGKVAVAGPSTKPDLKRKHQDAVKDCEENEENCGPIPIVKLEVSLFTLVRTRLHRNGESDWYPCHASFAHTVDLLC